MKLKNYITSFRLRTLPLSMSGIIIGNGFAINQNSDFLKNTRFWLVFMFAILTTLSLQILSNLCNELGDAELGTDQDQTARKAYGIQSGSITKNEMRNLIITFIALSVFFGTILVWLSFGSLFITESIVFLFLGACAIIGAIKYTLGKNNYGYKGFGDLGVFLFFGLLSTIGGYYLQMKSVSIEIIWAAIAIGCPIVGVLNLNNIRDMDNDKKHNKKTFASLLGNTGSKIYQCILMASCFAIFVFLKRYWVLLLMPIIIWHIIYIFKHDNKELDIQMPILMFTTIGIAILSTIPL